MFIINLITALLCNLNFNINNKSYIYGQVQDLFTAILKNYPKMQLIYDD